MNVEEEIIYDLLSGNTAVTSSVSVYDGQPAVFSAEAPQDAEFPYIIFGVIATDRWDTFTEPGWDTLVDVGCWTVRTGSTKAVHDMVEVARAALHRQTPTHADRSVAGILGTQGPGPVLIEEHAIGRTFTVRILSALR